LVVGVGNLFVEVVEGHDTSGGTLPLLPVLQGNLPTKDAADASIGILVGVTRVLVSFLFGLILLIRPLVVPAIVFVAVIITAMLPFAGVVEMDSWSESQLAEDGLAVVEITVPALGDAPEWDGWHLEFEGRTPVEGAEGAAFRVIRDIMSRFPNELAAALAGTFPRDDPWSEAQTKDRLATTTL
jgi:hypothetical protein